MQGNQSLLCMTVQTVYMANENLELEEGIEINWAGKSINFPLKGWLGNRKQCEQIAQRMFPAPVYRDIIAVVEAWHICAENDEALLEFVGPQGQEEGEEW